MSQTSAAPHAPSRTREPLLVALADQSAVQTAGIVAVLSDRTDLRLVSLEPGLASGETGALVYDVGAPVASYAEPVRRAREAGWVALALAWPSESRRMLRNPVGPEPDGWLPKAADGPALAASIVQAARSGRPVSGPAGRITGSAGGVLSDREYQMLVLIAAGLSNEEIAARCYLSINSVKTFIRSAYRKIDVRRRVQAVSWMHDHGYEHGFDVVIDAPPKRPAA